MTKKLFKLLNLAGIILIALLSCDLPMGMGLPIDFEPPTLYLSSNIENPMYVKHEAVITGTAFDNVGVVEIICRDSQNPERILGIGEITGNDFTITVNFSHEKGDNNRKITAEIIAYDAAGNSGENSIQFITFIVDLNPPLYESVTVERSRSRSINLQSIDRLKNNDPFELQHVDMFQNGAFWITANVKENETYAKSNILYLYDETKLNGDDWILKLDYEERTPENEQNPFKPEWIIKEGELVREADIKGFNYSSRLNNGESVYLKVRIVATDLAGNSDIPYPDTKVEDYGYICVSRIADTPKALLAGGIGGEIDPGVVIPVDLFDDDLLDKAWIDLMTKAQFESYGSDPDLSLEAIRKDLEKGISVPTWRSVKGVPGDQVFTQRITSENIESRTVSVSTGDQNDISNCGEYVLVCIVLDKKGDPHNASDPDTRASPKWGLYHYPFNIIDKNAAIIVIDTVNINAPGYNQSQHGGYDPKPNATSGGSPEESTFPTILKDGRFFSISGYTLDAITDQSPGSEQVSTFRVAWIPFDVIRNAGSADNAINKVKEALRSQNINEVRNYNTGYSGIQYWQLSGYGTPSTTSYFIEGTNQRIPDTPQGIQYNRQTFYKQFDLLGGPDDLAPSLYDNFTRIKGNSSSFENEDKYFVLYARNWSGNETFRTLRILGNKNPPSFKIYDFTNVAALNGITGNEPPSVNYGTIRDWAQAQPNLAQYEAGAFTIYPQNSVYKLYVTVDENHGVAIESMSFDDPAANINISNKDITFVKKLDNHEQSVFNFSAENKLGIPARGQRTIAVTDTAMLSAIAAAQQAGSYGSTSTINLRAQFTSPVRVRRAGDNVPHLNIRYETGGKGTETWTYTSIPFSGAITNGYSATSVYLDFNLSVGSLDPVPNGRLQTVDMFYTNSPVPAEFTHDRPINLNGALIQDADRENEVFLPKYYDLLTWGVYGVRGDTGNLQGNDLNPGKEIILDGRKPEILSFIPGGKQTNSPPSPNTTPAKTNWYYFNSDDTITFEIRANKEIRNIGIPRISFTVGGATYYAEYERPTDEGAFGGLLFTKKVSEIGSTTTMGLITNIALNTANGNIVDMVGNPVNASNLGTTWYSDTNTQLAVDRRVPAKTQTMLQNAIPVSYYKENPELTINNIDTANEPYGVIAEYSLDGGLTWTQYYPAKTAISIGTTGTTLIGDTLTIKSGKYRLVTRQRDKAGNESGFAESDIYDIEIEANFPKLISITTRQPRGIYKAGDSLEFILEFDRQVRTTTNGQAYIIVSDWERYHLNNTDSGNTQYFIQIPVTQNSSLSTRLSFNWNPIGVNTAHMPNGITLTGIYLNGVEDQFGNTCTGLRTTTNRFGDTNPNFPNIPEGNNTPNINGKQTEVLTWPPALVEEDCRPRNVNEAGASDPDVVLTARNIITLKFSHDVQKEMGKIYIRPYGEYPIPPVFPVRSYVDADGCYVESFQEVISRMDPTHQQYMRRTGEVMGTTSTGNVPNQQNQRRPLTDSSGKDLVSGQDYGPYKLTTQGLKQGAGYSGNNTLGEVANPHASNTGWSVSGSTYMVPDTEDKYVLDYRYKIDLNSGNAENSDTTRFQMRTGENNAYRPTTYLTDVTNIRAALNQAEYRWQSIDVIDSSVQIGSDKRTVTITLPYNLPKGMRWELQFDEGIFVDRAGNKVAPLNSYWFWTEGVQPPVIRVDRKSLDYRAPWEMSDVTDGKNLTYSDSGGQGTYMASLNSVSFRVESETPGVNIGYETRENIQYSYITVPNTLTGTITIIDDEDINWNARGAETAGTWVLPNLVRRAAGPGLYNGLVPIAPGLSYSVWENGIQKQYRGQGNLWVYRSYNRDATFSELDSHTPSTSAGNKSGSITIRNSTADPYKAGKFYVIGRAAITNGGETFYAKGYEGIFVTVVALRDANSSSGNSEKYFGTSDNPTQIFGSNIQSPTPSIAGFPIMLSNSDLRYLKIPVNAGNQGNNNMVWITTEITSSWFLQFASKQNSSNILARAFNRSGEVGNYLTGGYGDLTYTFNQDYKD